MKIMVDMFHTLWNDASEVTVDHCVEITLPVRYPGPPHRFSMFTLLMYISLVACVWHRTLDCIVRDWGRRFWS